MAWNKEKARPGGQPKSPQSQKTLNLLGSSSVNPADLCQLSVNGAGTGNEIDTPLTQARSLPVQYRPSNGTEGMLFDEHWCDHCTRDAAFREDMDRNDGCPILAATFALEVDNPDYPKEWVYDADGYPKCTAFTTDPSRPVRCDRTLDLFANYQ